jgi:hypothetical protein
MAMIDVFQDTMHAIVTVKTQVAVIAFVLTFLAALIIKSATDSTSLAALFVPALGFGCLVGVYSFKMAGVALSSSKDANVIAAAGIGMVVALVLMLIVVRIFGKFRDMTRPIDLAGRTQQLD